MRALIILLALLLPMQLSWAAMASYCQAENDRVPTHLGHHEHPSAKADDHAGSEKSKTSDSDVGCSLCHFSCMKSVQIYNSSVIVPPAAEQKSHPSYFPHPTSHIADGPDKPNWQLAA
ncbi:cobalt transporter [Herbaspirillum huttiense]|uniref:cobalt transporter n=1 Tax=Herbaspirillum TaxID=963 RepID=UPI001064A677|nr:MULTISPECIES: cobalt transporter [Herbaspirillum]MCI1016745.1 cobalt transporter [Herbaspirillum sp. C7C2]QBP73600.1 cobalt transporter [Herbaspirillum huttiense]